MQTTQTISHKPVVTPVAKTIKPVKAFANISATDQAVIKNAIGKADAGKADTTVGSVKPTAGVFALVAGTVRKLSPKLASSIKRQHVDKLETLKIVAEGHELTPAGVFHLSKRIDARKDEAKAIGEWMYNNGKLPASPGCAAWENKNFGPTNLLPGMRFPNIIHWGGFSSTEMRLAFALIWAK